jgi:hypothetical protein
VYSSSLTLNGHTMEMHSADHDTSASVIADHDKSVSVIAT